MHEIFFSIIIPAYNEAFLIEKTLISLQKLDYPHDRYEVVIVENGSTDTTYHKIKKYESALMSVYSLKEKGVSKARNFGIQHQHKQAEWRIVMDADTCLKKDFLRDLNVYLNTHPEVTYGMASLTPDTKSFTSTFWFWYRNCTDRLLKTMDVIHIVKNTVDNQISYTEEFNFTEDLQYAKLLLKRGSYFFFPTKQVVTSTRRFQEKGYLRMFFINLGIGILYTFNKNLLKNKEWQAIRIKS